MLSIAFKEKCPYYNVIAQHSVIYTATRLQDYPYLLVSLHWRDTKQARHHHLVAWEQQTPVL